MTLSQQLNIKQTQGFALTPQLQQAIKILELSNLELSQHIANEMLSNPFLSLDEGDIDRNEVLNDDPLQDEEQIAFDSQWGEGKANDSLPSSKDILLETLESKPIGLRDYLELQLATDILDPIEKMIGASLISIIEDTGYLPQNYKSQVSLLNVNDEKLDLVISRLQQFDPPGVFARSLCECIEIQLQDKGLLCSKTQDVLNHLELFELGDIQKLEKLCQITHDELKEILIKIRHCDPKPGLKYSEYNSSEIIPDIIISNSENEEWTVSLNEKTVPKLNIDKTYYEKVKKSSSQKAFISERYSAANAILKAIHQRSESILKVSRYILNHQMDFFQKGIHYLKPMILQDLAKELELHESTISRITTSKFMQTPRGTFELKFFFTSSIHSLTVDNQTSSRSVRARIQELIQTEDKKKPYSDDQLMVLLNKEGILAARRTVTKYRESLNIASSFQRKRQYKRHLDL